MDGLHPETFDKIVTLSKRSAGAELVRLPGEPEHVARVLWPDGARETLTAAPAPRRHLFGSLAALVAFVVDLKDAASAAVVWVWPKCVTVCLDDATRRDRATLRLAYTSEFIALRDSASEPRTQADFVRLLKLSLRYAVRGLPELVAAVRSLRFNGARTANGEVTNTRESMGRQITNECLGLDKLPDELLLSVRVFDTPDLDARQFVPCVLDVRPDAERLALVPAPCAIADAEARALGDIEAKIREGVKTTGARVYRGALASKSDD